MAPWSLSPEIVVVPAVCMEKACWENGLMLSQRRGRRYKKKRLEEYQTQSQWTEIIRKWILLRLGWAAVWAQMSRESLTSLEVLPVSSATIIPINKCSNNRRWRWHNEHLSLQRREKKQKTPTAKQRLDATTCVTVCVSVSGSYLLFILSPVTLTLYNEGKNHRSTLLVTDVSVQVTLVSEFNLLSS